LAKESGRMFGIISLEIFQKKLVKPAENTLHGRPFIDISRLEFSSFVVIKL
jgi:hypothetical protein